MLFCQYCGASLPNTSAVCGCRAKPKINDGGPAFAQVQVAPDPDFPGEFRPQLVGGMTLRDWFAGQTLAGLYAGRAGGSVSFAARDLAVDAEMAYRVADSMIAERERGKP